MALAVVLLVGAGLFIGSFVKLMRIDPGFDYRNVLLVNVGIRIPPGPYVREVYQEAEKRGRPYAMQMLDAVRAVPGVDAASAVTGGYRSREAGAGRGLRFPARGNRAVTTPSIGGS